MAMVGMRTVALVVAFVTLSCRRCACAPPRLRLMPLVGAKMIEPDTPFVDVINRRLMMREGTEEMLAWPDNQLLPEDQSDDNVRFFGFRELDSIEDDETLDERAENLKQIFVSVCEMNDDTCEHLYELGHAARPVVPEPVPTAAGENSVLHAAIPVQNEAMAKTNGVLAPDPEILWRPVTDRQERVDRVVRMVLSKQMQKPIPLVPEELTRVPESEVRWRPVTDQQERVTKEPEDLTRATDSEVREKPVTGRQNQMDAVVFMLLSNNTAMRDKLVRTNMPRAPDFGVEQKPKRGSRVLLDSVVRMLLSQQLANPQERTDPPRAPDSEVQWRPAADRQERVAEEPEPAKRKPPNHKFRDAVHEVIHMRAMQAEAEKAAADAAYYKPL